MELDPKGNVTPESNNPGILAFIWQLEPMSIVFYSWLVYISTDNQLTFGDVQFIVWLWRARFWSWNRNWRSVSHFLWKRVLFHWVVHVFTILLMTSFLRIWHIQATTYNIAEFVRIITWPLHWTLVPSNALCTTFVPSWSFHSQNHPVLQCLRCTKDLYDRTW